VRSGLSSENLIGQISLSTRKLIGNPSRKALTIPWKRLRKGHVASGPFRILALSRASRF